MKTETQVEFALTWLCRTEDYFRALPDGTPAMHAGVKALIDSVEDIVYTGEAGGTLLGGEPSDRLSDCVVWFRATSVEKAYSLHQVVQGWLRETFEDPDLEIKLTLTDTDDDG